MPTLYHHTKSVNLVGISLNGLTPHVPNPSLMTLGLPVVWLTKQTSLFPTPEDRERDLRILGEHDAEQFRYSVLPNRDTRLQVQIPKTSRKLHHYVAWLATTERIGVDAEHPYDQSKQITGRDVLKSISACSSQNSWFIYEGTIRPEWIDLQMTAALAMPGIEQWLSDAIEEGDIARMKRVADVREKLRKVSPETPVSFNLASNDTPNKQRRRDVTGRWNSPL